MTKKSFKIRDNLAQALDDTVASAKNNAGELYVQIIPLKKVELDVDNPRELALCFSDLHDGISKEDVDYSRKHNEKESLSSIAKSIAEQGVINPILVYKNNENYKLIAGERRTLASIIAGKEDIPAKILESKPSPLKISQLQWIENIERKDLTLWERLRNLEKIKSTYMQAHNSVDVSPADFSRLINCSIQQGVNYYHLLKSPIEVINLIKANKLNNIEKAAFISKSDALIQPMLIQACLDGASLKSLKNLSTAELKSLELPLNISSSPNKANLRVTYKLNAAKAILRSVLSHESYAHFHTQLPLINWNDPASITKAFKKLIKVLETDYEVESV